MRKTLLVLLFIVSCNSNKETKPTVCIESIEYHEFSNYRLKQPTLQINIKVEDSVILKKIKSGKLTKLVIFSIRKEDRNVVHCQVSKIPLRKGNTFSFLFWTNYFGARNFDGLHHRRDWDSFKITYKLSGDIRLVFGNDTIRTGNCKDKKIIMQLMKD